MPGPAQPGRPTSALRRPSRGLVGRPLTDALDPAMRDQAARIDPAADSPLAEPPIARPVPTKPRRRILRNWRVRSRLVLLIAIPTATAVALGGSSIVSSWRTAVAYQRVARLASLTAKITTLAYELEYERDNTVWFIALKTGPNGISNTNLSHAAQQPACGCAPAVQVHEQVDRSGPVRSGRDRLGLPARRRPRCPVRAIRARLHSERAQGGAHGPDLPDRRHQRTTTRSSTSCSPSRTRSR